MSDCDSKLTAEQLRQVLHYDADTGIFRWIKKTAKATHIGDIAGSPTSNGYLKIKIFKRHYSCHRLAWLYVTGIWPTHFVEHFNRDKKDNRFANLHDANRSVKPLETRVGITDCFLGDNVSKTNRTVTAERLREIIDYDRATGIFRWKINKSITALAGQITGCKSTYGYLVIRIDDVLYQCSRLAWLYVTGEWPKNDIDHKDGNTSNNRFDNLRDVTRSVNLENRRRAMPVNKTRLLGVSVKRKKFSANIQINKKHFYIGTYDTPEEAHEAYLEAKRKYHRGNTL